MLGTTPRLGQQRRSMASDTSKTGKEDVSISKHHQYIPPPSWSIKDLQLDAQHPPISSEELERLSRLALIDINSRTPEEKEKLNQDLANMLHMIQQVTDYQHSHDDNKNNTNDIFCSGEIYDSVRGVTSVPLRKNITEDPLQEKDTKQANEIWAALLEPKTIRKGGGHQYFAIATGDEDVTNDKK
jgi:Asp-tRNA(Asn)/Glu-tRNA(Gln) amidotransferase C subunit